MYIFDQIHPRNYKKQHDINENTALVPKTHMIDKASYRMATPPEFAKCEPVSNRFRYNVRVPDWPPLVIEKSLSV